MKGRDILISKANSKDADKDTVLWKLEHHHTDIICQIFTINDLLCLRAPLAGVAPLSLVTLYSA
jgi:hypothetical protein